MWARFLIEVSSGGGVRWPSRWQSCGFCGAVTLARFARVRARGPCFAQTRLLAGVSSIRVICSVLELVRMRMTALSASAHSTHSSVSSGLRIMDCSRSSTARSQSARRLRCISAVAWVRSLSSAVNRFQRDPPFGDGGTAVRAATTTNHILRSALSSPIPLLRISLGFLDGGCLSMRLRRNR